VCPVRPICRHRTRPNGWDNIPAIARTTRRFRPAMTAGRGNYSRSSYRCPGYSDKTKARKRGRFNTRSTKTVVKTRPVYTTRRSSYFFAFGPFVRTHPGFIRLTKTARRLMLCCRITLRRRFVNVYFTLFRLFDDRRRRRVLR